MAASSGAGSRGASVELTWDVVRDAVGLEVAVILEEITRLLATTATVDSLVRGRHQSHTRE